MSIEMIFRYYREIRPQSNLLLILNEPLLCKLIRGIFFQKMHRFPALIFLGMVAQEN